MQVLEIEHIIPRAVDETDDEENLWLACRLCNNAKGIKTHGYDPLTGRSVRFSIRGNKRGVAIFLGVMTACAR